MVGGQSLAPLPLRSGDLGGIVIVQAARLSEWPIRLSDFQSLRWSRTFERLPFSSVGVTATWALLTFHHWSALFRAWAKGGLGLHAL